MKIYYFELFGPIGFFISGLILIVAGLSSGDYLAVFGKYCLDRCMSSLVDSGILPAKLSGMNSLTFFPENFSI